MSNAFFSLFVSLFDLWSFSLMDVVILVFTTVTNKDVCCTLIKMGGAYNKYYTIINMPSTLIKYLSGSAHISTSMLNFGAVIIST